MNTRWMLGGALMLSMVAGCHRHRGVVAGGGGGAAVTPSNDDERAMYVLGMVLGERLAEFNLTRREASIVARGMTDTVGGGRPLVDAERFGPHIRELQRARQGAHAAQAQQEGTRFVEQAAHEPGAQRLAQGIVFREMQAGTGAQPSATDEVSVNYRGTLINGTEFDSSYTRHQPATFTLNGVIPCWTEGLQHMHVGGRARLVCPPEAAYGDRAQRSIPAGSTLIFEVELVSIRAREVPAATGDAAAPAAPAVAAPHAP
ncbi:MAG: FKBP-type peptidyl-prolyl cis-trans isomerase [Deltaproteobacteria bacterium]